MQQADAGFTVKGSDPKYVVIFDSIHYVIRAEKGLSGNGVWCDLIPTPRELSSQCGMSIEIRSADLPAALEILSDPGLRLGGVFDITPDGPRRVDE